MLAALLVALAIVMSITSKTPFLAYELATKMNHADRIEWYRMRDEKNNTISNQLFEKSRQLEAQRAERIKNNMDRN